MKEYYDDEKPVKPWKGYRLLVIDWKYYAATNE
ncbi:MAG: hypothetical protein ACI9FN_001999 [Saprospiraceae bacterium]|jgi:hypothetical protein